MLICPFISSFFFLSSFQTLKFFVTLFSGTVRPRRLKLGTHVDSGQMYLVYQNQAAALIRPFISSFFFLSNYQPLKIFVTFFSELWGLEEWNLVHTWIVGRCIVYTGIRLLLLICPFIFSFSFLSNFQTLKFFITLFSWTVRPRRLKIGTHVDSGQMYRVYRNQAAAAYSSFISSFSFQFSNIKIFLSHLYQELWGIEGWNLVHMWTVGVWCIPESGCCSLFLLLFFLSLQFSNIKIFLSHLSQELWGLEGWNVIPTWTMGGWIVYTESFHNIFLQNCKA